MKGRAVSVKKNGISIIGECIERAQHDATAEDRQFHCLPFGISEATRGALLATALVTGVLVTPTAVSAETSITQSELVYNPYLGQTREFASNELDMGILYGVFDQQLQNLSRFQDVENFEQYLEMYDNQMKYVDDYDMASDNIDMSIYTDVEPPVDPPVIPQATLIQNGIPNAMRLYGKKSGATQEAGVLLRGTSFSDVSIEGSAVGNGSFDQDSYGYKAEGKIGFSNGNQGVGVRAYATDEHHEINMPKTAIDLFAAGAEVVAIPVTYQSESGKLRIAPYMVGGVETVEQKMEIFGLKDKDSATELSCGAGVIGAYETEGFKADLGVEFRKYESGSDLFGDADAVYIRGGIDKRLSEEIGITANAQYRDLDGDYNEKAFEYEVGPYVDIKDVKLSAGIRGDCIDGDWYDYDSTRGFGQLEITRDGMSFFVTADSDGCEHRVSLGAKLIF
jgi:hypothetical protein